MSGEESAATAGWIEQFARIQLAYATAETAAPEAGRIAEANIRPCGTTRDKTVDGRPAPAIRQIDARAAL